MTNDLELLGRQVGWEQRSYWRNPAAAGFSFVFPILIMVIFATTNGNGKIAELGNISYTQYYIPAIVAFGIMGVTFTNLAITVTFKREAGTLKRVRGAPLPAWIYLGGLIGNSVVVGILLTAIVIAFGVIAYGVSIPGNIAALIVTLAIGAACFCAMGLAVTTVVPNADAAPAIVNLLFFPLLFISGTFFPISKGSVLTKIAGVFPVRHFITGTFAAFDPHARSSMRGGDLLVMVAWGAVALLVASRRFRWEPSTK
ncbi:MAG: type transport system permease protein [Acidimicrobiaceae bacterium]|jgi:ABC-2 type transport system permease protein|nr:type transport system permease protein [Acidimicrobiaceae bacterium]MDQ1427249.1 type transport system permease protein [Acidimicrobiaceae bacterium]